MYMATLECLKDTISWYTRKSRVFELKPGHIRVFVNRYPRISLNVIIEVANTVRPAGVVIEVIEVEEFLR